MYMLAPVLRLGNLVKRSQFAIKVSDPLNLIEARQVIVIFSVSHSKVQESREAYGLLAPNQALYQSP